MSFTASPSRAGGRAYGVLMWAIGLGSILLLLIFYQATVERLWIDVLVEAIGPYFVFMGLAAGAGQLPNAAERLPGHRQYDVGSPGRVPPPVTPPSHDPPPEDEIG